MTKQITIKLRKIKIEVIMDRRGMELAKFLGVSRQTISNKLNGKSPISLKELNKISDFLALDVDELIEIKKRSSRKARPHIKSSHLTGTPSRIEASSEERIS